MAVFRADLSTKAPPQVSEKRTPRKRLSCGDCLVAGDLEFALEDGHAAVLGHGYGFPLGDLSLI